MDMTFKGSLRTSMESAFTHHFHVLEEHTKNHHATGTPNTLVDESIADDIDYLRGLVPAYWCRLNRVRSPLLRLPPELLPIIILYAATSGKFPRLGTWLQLGHICYDLRVAILGMHALWAEVVFEPRYTPALEELLARAKACPINIFISYWPTQQRLLRAIDLLARARKVEISACMHPVHAKDIIEALIQGQNPVLEVLKVGLDRKKAIAHGNTYIPVDQPMLIAPMLRTITFSNIFIPVDMSSLCDLSLRWLSLGPTPIPDARTFGDMLGRCARLKNLSLHGWIPACSALKTLHQSGYRISLPYLTHLHLWQDMDHTLALWNILVIPTSATVDVDYADATSVAREEPVVNLKDLLVRTRSLRAFLPQMQRCGVSQVTKISVFIETEELCVQLGTADSGLLSQTNNGSSHQTPSLPWDSSQNHVFQFFTPFWVQTLDDIVTFLECLCTTLQLRVDSIDTVEYVLGSEELVGDDDQDTYMLYTLFPAATALRFDDSDPHNRVDISRILGSSSPQGLDCFPKLQGLHLDQTFSQSDMERLIDTLNIRAEQGRSLHVLTLEQKFFESRFTSHP
ncbi:hypothetical protein PENSPDRAFT_695368 [Peniophora sp. CONT]|nr:hypothetical protein PENSPDRAFT_695368 [Peniophora sp. CONT]